MEEIYITLEGSLKKKGTFQQFAKVLAKYFQMKHAEPVPVQELDRQCIEVHVYYFPMHAGRKEDTVEPQYSGHSIKQPPHYCSHLVKSQAT